MLRFKLRSETPFRHTTLPSSNNIAGLTSIVAALPALAAEVASLNSTSTQSVSLPEKLLNLSVPEYNHLGVKFP